MSPTTLPSAFERVPQLARDLLDAHVSQPDAVWIVTTALIVEALKRAQGNKSRAAKMLGMNRNCLKQQIRERYLESVIEDVKILVDAQLPLFDQKRPAGRVREGKKVLSRRAAA
jgi:hypothetical protein